MEKEKQRLAELEAEKKREEDVLKKRIIARYDEQVRDCTVLLLFRKGSE